jgi:hypothetical protein
VTKNGLEPMEKPSFMEIQHAKIVADEAKYKVIVYATAELSWFRSLFYELGTKQPRFSVL